MNVSRRWTPAIVLLTAVSIASATSALAQATVVNGTGNPNVDIPALQAAVNCSLKSPTRRPEHAEVSDF